MLNRRIKYIFLESENLNAYRLYIRMKQRISVAAFVKPFYFRGKTPSNWQGVPVLQFEQLWESKLQDVKLILFEHHPDRLAELVKILQAKGKQLGQDYLWWENLTEPYRYDFPLMKKIGGGNRNLITKFAGQRKVCFVNGNCQTALLKKYLMANDVFRKRYMLLDLPEICNMPKDVNVDAVLSIADLILTQPVKETNRFTPKLSAAYLKQHKKDGARVVEISLLNFSGYFPQYSHDSKHLVLGRPLVSYGDANIDQMVNDGCTTAEIARRLSAEDYYDGNELTCHFAKSFQAFCAREETCDIKMQDYLKVHYRDDILFHAFNHPKDFVIKELARRILRYIGIVSDDFEDEVLLDKSSRMYAQEQPVYPSVYRYLKLPYRKPYASPNLLATGWRFAFRDYVEFYVNALKEDSSAPQPQKRQTTVFIWGSCISRELFNYTEAFDLTGYLLQNSIQTLQAEAVEIPEEDVKGSSNFTKRMFLMESRKTAVQYFQDHKADYLMIDTCDCRNHVWRNKRNPKIRFCSSITADQTMALPKYNEEYEKISVFAITEEEWDAYVDHFCDVITQVYPVERIILNKFRFAEDYIKDGEVLPFPNQELYRGFGRITASIEQKIEERLPGIQVISPEEHTIGDYYSHIGTSAMHFLDEIYMRQAKKLEDIVYG